MTRNAYFFGLGSIGMRHMRLLMTYFPEVEVYHWRRDGQFFERCPDMTTRIPIDSPPADEAESPSMAFICTPTEAHLETALSCAGMGLTLFMEKPVDVSSRHLDETLRVIEAKGLDSYVAYPLRYHPFVDWLYWQNVKELDFVCRTDASKWPSKRELNHVVWELSHEFDLAAHLLGDVRAIRGECSPDGLRCEAVLEHHPGGLSRISLDMGSPLEERFIRYNGHEYPIRADDLLYLRQLCLWMDGVTDNDLEEASGLFLKLEEFVGKPVGR